VNLSQFRTQLWRVLHAETTPTGHLKRYRQWWAALILLNVFGAVIETVPTLSSGLRQSLHLFERASMALYTVEYILRMWACTSDEAYQHPVWGRLRYATTPLLIIDLLVLLPFVAPVLMNVDLRGLRVFRLLLLIRLSPYNRALKILGGVITEKRYEMGAVATLASALLFVSSTVMYYIEHPAQPQVFSSIPATMWWSVATFTTVGYGDIYPITAWGKFFASISAFIGIGFFAMPAAILASGFAENLLQGKTPIQDETPAVPTHCPHCGESLALEQSVPQPPLHAHQNNQAPEGLPPEA
jgi:voltage-gated potassium channel